MAEPKKAAKSSTAKESAGLSQEELAALKERTKEVRTQKRRGAKADLEGEVLAKIAEMPPADRVIAERIHAIVKANAPQLSPKLWYGQPAYASAEGKVVCFFQAADKFNTRYATLGFNEEANLDDGSMWATSFALTKLTAADEKKIAELVKRAVR